MSDEDKVQSDPQAFDASDPKAVNDAKRRAGRQAKEDRDVIRKLMHSQQGRSWLWRKLIAFRAFQPPYVPQVGMTAMDVTYHAGQQKLGLDLLAEVMDASTDLYLTMWREQNPQDSKT